MLHSMVPMLSDDRADAARVARSVDAQVVLERDDRRQRRHVRRHPQDLGAVDDVPLHDRRTRRRSACRAC